MFGAVSPGIPSFGDLAWKSPVRLVTYAALAANTYAAGVLTANANGALATIDGVAPAVGDRVLVAAEAPDWHNGIYTVTSLGSAGTKWTMTRATDDDEAADMVAGASCYVTSGTLYAGTVWTEAQAATPTSGTPAWASTYLSGSLNGSRLAPAPATNAAELDLISTGSNPAIILLGNTDATIQAEIRHDGGGHVYIQGLGTPTVDLTIDGGLIAAGRYVPGIGGGDQGIQSGRQQVGASIAAGGSRTDTITLPVAYADASYTVVLVAQMGNFATGGILCQINGAPVAGSFSVRTTNLDSIARQPTIHWLTLHD